MIFDLHFLTEYCIDFTAGASFTLKHLVRSVLRITEALELSDCSRSLSVITVGNSQALELHAAHEVYLRSVFENSAALE